MKISVTITKKIDGRKIVRMASCEYADFHQAFTMNSQEELVEAENKLTIERIKAICEGLEK